MIDARTLLLAEQAHRAEGGHATADLLRNAAQTISSLRTALRLARAQIAAVRDGLILADNADLDVVLAQIDEVLK